MAMFDYTNFDHVFGSQQFPYDRKSIQEVETFRKSFNGALFIDRVLKALGLTKAKTYPPKTENALRSLHQQLCDATMSTHHRLSIFYYILLDFDTNQSRAQPSSKFAIASGVPKSYQIFMKGLWLLDHQQFEKALEYIAHPSLTTDFADEIMTVLVQHAPEGDYTLPLSYFHTVQPILKTPEALELLFNAMAGTSVTEAFYYSRTHSESVRGQLFRQLIASVLGAAPSQETAARATELIGLPLDTVEESWFEEFLTQEEGKKLRVAKDTLLMRKLVTGRYSEAVQDKSLGNRWGVVLEGIKSGLGGRAE
ncbi:nuclear pore assembly complex assembly domain-containing protein [Colletotrichum truncatum]|uniref:Nuclear pore assembly complex assembly domain-containing protein n=1 Tax=Colletotrichum truncatum TaxID=5467 RepID=A0ACC3YXU2_COLTU